MCSIRQEVMYSANQNADNKSMSSYRYNVHWGIKSGFRLNKIITKKKLNIFCRCESFIQEYFTINIVACIVYQSIDR